MNKIKKTKTEAEIENQKENFFSEFEKKIDIDVTRKIRKLLNEKKEKSEDEEIIEIVKKEIAEIDKGEKINLRKKAEISKIIFERLRKNLSILDEYIKDDDINEIMVIGTENIFVERNGTIKKLSLYFESKEELNEIVRRIASGVHREINELNPILDARLSDGSRASAVYENISLRGTTLTIRKFPKTNISMEDLINFKTINKNAAKFLESIVKASYNIFISGGTTSGKTTFLNALSNFIPKNERVITIEDSAELKIDGIENLVVLEAKMSEGSTGKVEIKDLIKTSLRMRPDRIIVGEVRGKEALDMIQAMNTGHDGSLSTGHANSAKAMLSRLEAMFLEASNFPIKAIRTQIAEGIDIMIHLSRLSGNRRVVSEISEVLGIEDGEIQIQKLYKYQPNKGLVKTKNELKNVQKLEMIN